MQPEPAERSLKTIGGSRRESSSLSERAKVRMLEVRGEPLFVADWDEVLMIHFAVDAKRLQGDVPFKLDLREGWAFVTLVTFTMRGMRLAFGRRLTSWVFRPMATHDFLNVRTYVEVNGEPGIHFLAEWLSSRLAVALGPRSFSLPYRFGKIQYQNDWRRGAMDGSVTCPRTQSRFAYSARLPEQADFASCERDSRDGWLMERYSAFNSAGGRQRFFRVWHPPWPQVPAEVKLEDLSLLERHWPWFATARVTGANYSPGLRDVWLGRPHRI